MEKQVKQSVVGDINLPKFKLDGKRAAYVNAAAVTVATYLGVVAIFAAISGFTKGDWLFGVPPIISTFFGASSLSFLGASVSIGPSALFVTALIALTGGIIGFLTLKKLTDATAVKNAWKLVAEIFGVITGLLAIYLVSTVLWSLLGLGEKSGVDQGNLWLSTFLPTLIKVALSGTIYCLASRIAAGKLEVLRLLGMVATGIAVVAIILVVIQTMTIDFYGKKSSSSVFDDDFDWSSWLD